MLKKFIKVWLIAVILACLVPAGAMAGTQIYFNDFDAAPTVAPGVSAALAGVTTTTGVQGYAGLGPSGNQFGGNFLRNTSTGNPASSTTLTLTGLPAHTSVNVNFLLGIIDSWDGYGSGFGPDAFNVTVDGVSVFSQVFATAGGSMTYLPGSPVLLSSGTHLGFNGSWTDKAYNMYLEPAFQNIAHTGSSLAISWFASGPVWQGGVDESWAMDNVQVVLNGVTAVPLPPSVMLLGSGLLGLLGAGWRLRKP
ncbi:MAG: PEP-CTERM sorting domain-containing protein [Deltaproteobacteria bacterium]|nr:PEP-CTERM sorting domain-containing protein [Deltaproteobacteria bacterium]